MSNFLLIFSNICLAECANHSAAHLGTACWIVVQGLLILSASLLGPSSWLRGSCLIPLHNPPQASRAFRRADAKNASLAPLWRILAEKMAFQEAFKKRSNFDSISALDFDPLGSIFGSQDASKIHPKSIKIGFPTHSCFCIVFYIDFWSILPPKVDLPNL